EPLELDRLPAVHLLLDVEPGERMAFLECVELDHEAVRAEDGERMQVEPAREAEALDDLRPTVHACRRPTWIALRGHDFDRDGVSSGPMCGEHTRVDPRAEVVDVREEQRSDAGGPKLLHRREDSEVAVAGAVGRRPGKDAPVRVEAKRDGLAEDDDVVAV